MSAQIQADGWARARDRASAERSAVGLSGALDSKLFVAIAGVDEDLRCREGGAQDRGVGFS